MSPNNSQMRDQVTRQTKYNNGSSTHGLAHNTSSTIEPQGPQITPHSIPTPATDDVIYSMSISCPPAKTTVPAELLPPHVITTYRTMSTPSQLDWAAKVNKALNLSPTVHEPGKVPPDPTVDMPPCIKTDPGGTTFATLTTSGTTCLTHSPLFIHHAIVDAP